MLGGLWLGGPCRPGWAQPTDITADALAAQLAAVPERRATFQEEKTIGALAQPLLSWGRLSYQRPARMEKVTTGPQPEQLVVDGSRLVLTEGQDPPRAVDLDSVPELRALVDTVRGTLSGDLPSLRRSFDLAVSGTAAGWRMVLTPRDPRVAKLVARVVIDGAGSNPLTITTTQANGDTDRLSITPGP